MTVLVVPGMACGSCVGSLHWGVGMVGDSCLVRGRVAIVVNGVGHIVGSSIVSSGFHHLGWLLDHSCQGSSVSKLLHLLNSGHFESFNLCLSVKKSSDVFILFTDLNQFSNNLIYVR